MQELIKVLCHFKLNELLTYVYYFIEFGIQIRAHKLQNSVLYRFFTECCYEICTEKSSNFMQYMTHEFYNTVIINNKFWTILSTFKTPSYVLTDSCCNFSQLIWHNDRAMNINLNFYIKGMEVYYQNIPYYCLFCFYSLFYCTKYDYHHH